MINCVVWYWLLCCSRTSVLDAGRVRGEYKETAGVRGVSKGTVTRQRRFSFVNDEGNYRSIDHAVPARQVWYMRKNSQVVDRIFLVILGGEAKLTRYGYTTTLQNSLLQRRLSAEAGVDTLHHHRVLPGDAEHTIRRTRTSLSPPHICRRSKSPVPFSRLRASHGCGLYPLFSTYLIMPTLAIPLVVPCPLYVVRQRQRRCKVEEFRCSTYICIYICSACPRTVAKKAAFLAFASLFRASQLQYNLSFHGRKASEGTPA